MPEHQPDDHPSIVDRPPLNESTLFLACIEKSQLWQQIKVVSETGSTNDDLLVAAKSGRAEGAVLIAETQTAGRGRLDRQWSSPPRAGLTFSVLLRPSSIPPVRWGWLPLLTGLAVQQMISELTTVDSRLKWPNDVLFGPHRRKGAGILVQVTGSAVVIGIGLNVTTARNELPIPEATSLVLEGEQQPDRGALCCGILDRLAIAYTNWRSMDGDPVHSGLRSAYLTVCDTIGREITVELPNGQIIHGIATSVDESARLIVSTENGSQPVAAGDVRHLR